MRVNNGPRSLDQVSLGCRINYFTLNVGRGGGVGRGLGLGCSRGVGLGRGVVDGVGVAVEVAVGVGVAVAVGVGVAVTVGLGVGVEPNWTSKEPISIRPFLTRSKPGPR